MLFVLCINYSIMSIICEITKDNRLITYMNRHRKRSGRRSKIVNLNRIFLENA
jgi:hypothetical protein